MEFKINENKDLIYIGESEETKEAYVTFPANMKGVLVVRHVFVDPKYRGQGVASKLMNELVKYARENNKKITCMCNYASSWFSKHEEYSDLLE